MIVQVVGTNGSGKTAAVRRVLAEAELVDGPGEGSFAYTYLLNSQPLIVMGKYDNVSTSGCDRIKVIQPVYDAVISWDRMGYNVLFEGIRMMNHMRGLDMVRRVLKIQHSVAIVQLTTTFDECMAGIRARQALAGRVKDVSEINIYRNVTRARNYVYKLMCLGAKIVWASRDEAPGVIVELLRGEA